MGKTIAYVDITLDDTLEVKGFTVVNGQNGPFLGMPQRKIGEKWSNSAYIKDRDLRSEIERQALSELGLTASSSSAPAGKGRKSSAVPREYQKQAGVDSGWE